MQAVKLLCRYSIQVYSRNNIAKASTASLWRYLSSPSNLETFRGETDRYTGITVDTGKEKCSQEHFTKILDDSINKWRKEGNRCIWFRVNIKDAGFVPILAQKGFNFHHAREDFVMMYKWLPGDSEANLPPMAHTNLGVGAAVFNSKKQILAISEKHYEYPHWKLPGGYVEPGEDIIDAAIREVKEETSVDASFLSLVTFRHSHKMMYNNSDIYTILMMKALTENISIPSNEVKECRWMDVEEYTNHPHVHEFNRLIIHKALEYQRKGIKLDFPKKRVKWATYTRDMNFLVVTECKY